MPQPISLRAFVLSEGPKSAKMLHLDAERTLAQQFLLVRRTLRLAETPLSEVNFHTTVKKRVDVRPLAQDKPVSSIGLKENDILIVRLRKQHPSPQRAEHSPRLPVSKPDVHVGEDQSSPVSSRSSSSCFETPSPSTPSHRTAASRTRPHSSTEPRPTADISADSPLPTVMQATRDHSTEARRSAHGAIPAAESGMANDVLGGSAEEQHVTTLSEGAADCRRRACHLLSHIHLCLAATAVSHNKTCAPDVSVPRLSDKDEQEFHRVLLEAFAEQAGRTANADVGSLFLDPKAIRAVYPMIERAYSLVYEDGSAPSPERVEWVRSALAQFAPGLAPAARLVCVLYQGREREFLTAVASRAFRHGVLSFDAPLAYVAAWQRWRRESAGPSREEWWDVVSAARCQAAEQAALRHDSAAYARLLESAVEALHETSRFLKC